MQRAEQVFLILVFAVSLFFVFIAFRETPTGYELIVHVGALMAASAMICWFIRGASRRRPPDAG